MLEKFGIEARFIAVVSFLSIVLVGVVVGILVVTTSRMQNDLTETMIMALKEEQKVEKDLLDRALKLKGESLTSLLAQTGSSLIIGYDFSSLLTVAQNAANDPDVAYVVYYDKEGRTLTEEPSSKEGLLTINAPIFFEEQEIGTVELGLSRAFVEKASAQVEEKIDKVVAEAQAQRNSYFKRTLLQSSAITIMGVIALCLIVYWVMVRLVSRPIKGLSAHMDQGAQSVLQASEQLAAAGQTLAEAASEQAAGVEETSSSLEEINSMSRGNAENASHAAIIVRDTQDKFEEASIAMHDLQESIREISQASEETQKIIKTIDEIAFQTNLLSLNAAVEAARAGEAGAGFAVVADEVRNLAMRAAEAAKNTSTIIEDIMKKIQVGSRLVDSTGSSFKDVKQQSVKLADIIGEIAEASREQAAGIEQISRAISEMDQIVQKNAASAEETASSAESLRAQSKKMEEIVRALIVLVEGTRKHQGIQHYESLAVWTKRSLKTYPSMKENGNTALASSAFKSPALPHRRTTFSTQEAEGFEDF